jgi:hypothetical protein
LNISTVGKTSFEINYFTNNYQNGALSIYATVALFLLFLCLPRYPADQWLRMRRLKNYRFLLYWGIDFLVSSNKSNDLLIFTLPLAIMATNHIEIPQVKLKQEMVLIVLIACLPFLAIII